MNAYIADRDALAKALSVARDPGEHSPLCSDDALCRYCYRLADALIASGAVIDAATLADDEALSMALAECVWTEDEPTAAEYSLARAMLKALPEAIAAALTERAR